MKTRFLLVTALALVARHVTAQEIDPKCPPGSLDSQGNPDNTMVAQDACQKAIDLFKYVAPQLGMVLAGGSPTQGVSGALGPGHFSFGIRANGLSSSLPEVDKVVPNTRGAQQSTYTLDTTPIGFVTADLALGLYKGLSDAGFGALDLLVSAAYVPEYSSPSIEVSVPSGSFRFGWGAKMGVIRETSTAPGVSVSYLTRGLPRVDIVGTSGEDRLLLENVKVRSKSWRAIAGKSFLFFGLGAGYGRDTYDSNARITVTVAPRAATQGGTGGPTDLSQELTRNNFFGTVWIRSQVIRIVGEIGRVSGGDIVTYNLFSGAQAADPRTYVSVGVSFGR